eukprot:766586-Pyramimonas_sp.AAC.1
MRQNQDKQDNLVYFQGQGKQRAHHQLKHDPRCRLPGRTLPTARNLGPDQHEADIRRITYTTHQGHDEELLRGRGLLEQSQHPLHMETS